MTNEGGGPAPHIVEKGLMWLFAVVLGVMALIFIGAGAYLATLGGSLYYVVAGLLFLGSAILLFTGKRLGAWLFGLALAITIVWSLWEVGFDGWALMPRLMIPVAFGIWLLLPWSQHALKGSLALARRVPMGATGLIAGSTVAAVAIGALLYGVTAPTRPQDPRFQTGFGAFPAANGGAPAGQTGQDWPYFGGDQGGQKYTPLDEITLDNVANLEVAWSVDVGRIPANNSTPIKVGDAIYMCNGFSQAFALDAKTGAERWTYDGSEGHGGTCRGVTYHKAPGLTGACAERVLFGTATAKLIALDAKTGALCADFGQGGIVDLLVGMEDHEGKIIGGYYSITSAPTFVRGKVVIGGWVTDGQYWGEASGVIRAFDAVTGELSWAWDLGRQDRTGAPPEGESYTVATPNSWAPATADEELGLVYLPTGNATPDFFGGQRSTTSSIPRSLRSTPKRVACAGPSRPSTTTSGTMTWRPRPPCSSCPTLRARCARRWCSPPRPAKSSFSTGLRASRSSPSPKRPCRRTGLCWKSACRRPSPSPTACRPSAART